MHNMLLIARREYMEQIRGRAFRMSTVGLPVLFAVILGIAYFANKGTGSHKHYIVASTDAALAGAVRDQLDSQKDSSPRVDIVDPSVSGETDAINRLVRTKAVSGALIITPHPGGLPTADYYSNSAGDFITGAKLTDALDNGIVNSDLIAEGMPSSTAAAVVKGVKVETWQVKKDGSIVKSNAEASFWKGYVMAILLSMTTLIYGLNVARSIIQEKTSRIFEVMLATVKPTDMLAGKLLGVGSVGLTQILIWVVAAAALLATPLATAILTGQYAVHFSWTEGILFPVYFVLGFLLYSSLFAGLAATCETEQELQMYTPLAAAPTWLSFTLIIVIMNDSNSPLSIAASLFPPTAPIIMFLRMAAEMPPAWQFAVSIGLMLVSIWAILWLSSRLYRIGILMYGKRATLPEIIRWLRYS
ncbi:MAG TPA: ABC transporter permease [Silvibacterium sp.]|nr:ABC transporter permease [Silvibacterium sp.]